MSLKSALNKFGSDGNIDSAELKSLKMDYFSEVGYKKFAKEMRIHQRRGDFKIDGSKKKFKPKQALEILGYQKGGKDRWDDFKKSQNKAMVEAGGIGGAGSFDWKRWQKTDEGKAVYEAAMKGEPLGNFQFNTTSDPTDDNFEPKFEVSYVADRQAPQQSSKDTTTFNSDVKPLKFDEFKIERQDVSKINKKYSLDKIQDRIDETAKNALRSPKAPNLDKKKYQFKELGEGMSFAQVRNQAKEIKENIKNNVAFNPDPLKLSMVPGKKIEKKKKKKTPKNLGPVLGEKMTPSKEFTVNQPQTPPYFKR